MKKFTCLLLSLLIYCFVGLLLPSSVFAAKFSLDPFDYETRTGRTFEVKVNLDTEDKKVSGVDLVLEYPKDLVWVDKVDWGELFEDKFINVNIKGKLSLSAARDNDEEYFQGSGRLVTLTFSTHGVGTANVDFICRAGGKDETNVIEFETDDDLVDCGRLRKGIYVIHSKNWYPGEEDEEEEKSCTQAPSAPGNLKAVTGPGNAEVKLTWDKASNASFYTVSYGLISGNYIYGAPNIGDTNQYVIKQLSSAKTYYFVMTAVNDCGSSGYSAEVSAKAAGGAVVGPTYQPTVVDYVPEEPEVTASPSAEPEASPTEEPSLFSDVKPKEKTKLPFWLKYLAIGVGVGLFLIIVGQELLSALKRPPEPPVQKPEPPVQKPEPPNKPVQKPPFDVSQEDRPPKPFTGQPPPNNQSLPPWQS